MRLEPMPLSQLAAVRSGGGAPQDPSAFTKAGYPFIRAGSLPRLLDGATEDSLERLEPRVADEHGLNMFPAGTVVFAKSGMSATKGHVYRLKAQAYVVNHLAALIPHDPNDSEFLVRVLQRFSPTVLIKDPAYPSIRLGDIENMKVLAPLDEASRRRIAEILDKADALRAKRRTALAQLDTLTQSIFLDMFGDPATNPKGWPRRSISDIATVVTGNTPSRAVPGYYGTDIEWVKSDNINTPHYYLTRAEEGLSGLGKEVARVVPAGSILVTCIAGSPECIGNAAMTDREVAFNQQINALIPRDGDVHFIYVQLLVGKRLVQQASTAAMKGMVNKSRFERVALLWPPLSLQRDFANRVQVVQKLTATERASIENCDALFASLQHRAFRGEL